MAHQTRVHLFGPTRVTQGPNAERAIRVLGKQGRILAMLAMRPGHPVTKDRLAEAVWDGRPPPSFRQALDSDVCVLRRRAGLGPGRSSALATTTAGYVLDPERVWVDLQQAGALADLARTQRSGAALESSSAALDLASAELLEDEPYAAWAIEARAAWHSNEMDLCLLASRAAIIEGDLSLAIRCARRALARESASEPAAVQLMRALWWGGRRAEALRVFLSLRDRMLDELGEQPGAEAQRLYLTILRDGEPSLREAPTDLEHISLALALLRDALEQTPGLRPPARDADLAAAAAAALAQRHERRTAAEAAAS